MSKNISRLSWGLALILIVCAVLGSIPSTAFAQAEEQYIKFDYLKRIEGTPFAEKIHTVIRVPVYANHEIKLEDVKKALKLKTFGVMQSYYDRFNYDAATDTYSAVYNKSVYLYASTADGKGNRFYLDCNLSFKDYFYSFVKDGVLDEGAYEVFFNGMIIDYPILDSYSKDEVYGYYGFIPIPLTRNLNSLWNDLFGSTYYKGELKHFKYEYSLSLSAYTKLLEDYKYSWLQVAWNDIKELFSAGSANANFYVIYVDSQTTEALIMENGATSADDNHGAMFNGIKDAANAAINAVKTFFSDKKNVALIIGLFIGVIILAGIILAIVLAVKNITKSVTKEAVKTKNKNGR